MIIYILHESYSGFFATFLDLLSVLSFLFAIFIIASKNPIVSVLFLIMLFSTISIYLILIGVKFIGISYLLVYVGAVSILFLFILMLINIRVSELVSVNNNNIPLAFLTVLAFVNPVNHILPDNLLRLDSFSNFLANSLFVYTYPEDIRIFFVSSSSWDANLYDNIDIIAIGNIFYSNYSIWLIICSIILLLAMVGGIVITNKQKNV